MIYTVKIEQTFAYPKRMKYVPKTDTFIEKECDSLSYVRNVRQPYGWIKESGTPPCGHLDVIVMTDNKYELGDEDKIKIISVFCRNDGDNKERILIVSHGTALSFLQSMIMGYSFADIEKFRFDGVEGSVSKFVIEPDGKVIARYVNQRVC